jgi:hypothetical protein
MTEKQVLEETIAKYNDSVNDISKFKFSSKEVELFCGMLTRFADMKISELKNLNIADVSHERDLLISFHTWQQKLWTSPNAEITENVVDVYLKSN